jgi:hypothetical protein
VTKRPSSTTTSKNKVTTPFLNPKPPSSSSKSMKAPGRLPQASGVSKKVKKTDKDLFLLAITKHEQSKEVLEQLLEKCGSEHGKSFRVGYGLGFNPNQKWEDAVESSKKGAQDDLRPTTDSPPKVYDMQDQHDPKDNRYGWTILDTEDPNDDQKHYIQQREKAKQALIQKRKKKVEELRGGCVGSNNDSELETYYFLPPKVTAKGGEGVKDLPGITRSDVFQRHGQRFFEKNITPCIPFIFDQIFRKKGEAEWLSAWDGFQYLVGELYEHLRVDTKHLKGVLCFRLFEFRGRVWKFSFGKACGGALVVTLHKTTISGGYPELSIKNKHVRTHQLAAAVLFGNPIIDGNEKEKLEVDHIRR